MPSAGSIVLASHTCSPVRWQATIGVSRAPRMISISLCNFPSNQFRIWCASFGTIFVSMPAVRAALAPPYQFNAIDRRSALKIDFWMLRADPFEISMFERRLRVSFLGERTWIATAEDVILHKLYWDSLTPSERQISDAAGVVAVQSDSLDRAYLQQWAGELRVSEKLNKLLVGEIRPKST